MKLNNDIEIPQIGVGTWTLRGETARQNVRLALELALKCTERPRYFPLVNVQSDYLNHLATLLNAIETTT